jgi:hypothetical protein
MLTENISAYNGTSLDRINTFTGGFMANGDDQVTAHKEAIKVLNGTISVQS